MAYYRAAKASNHHRIAASRKYIISHPQPPRTTKLKGGHHAFALRPINHYKNNRAAIN
jgi:hypothetical protein